MAVNYSGDVARIALDVVTNDVFLINKYAFDTTWRSAIHASCLGEAGQNFLDIIHQRREEPNRVFIAIFGDVLPNLFEMSYCAVGPDDFGHSNTIRLASSCE